MALLNWLNQAVMAIVPVFSSDNSHFYDNTSQLQVQIKTWPNPIPNYYRQDLCYRNTIDPCPMNNLGFAFNKQYNDKRSVQNSPYSYSQCTNNFIPSQPCKCDNNTNYELCNYQLDLPLPSYPGLPTSPKDFKPAVPSSLVQQEIARCPLGALRVNRWTAPATPFSPDDGLEVKQRFPLP